MPIRPENRWLYPIDWPLLSDQIRFVRAGGRGKPVTTGEKGEHHPPMAHVGQGRQQN